MSITIEVPKFWVFHYRCGHPFGVLVADQRPTRVIATAEQAWHDFYRGSKKRRAKARAAGGYVSTSEYCPDLKPGPHIVDGCLGFDPFEKPDITPPTISDDIAAFGLSAQALSVPSQHYLMPTILVPRSCLMGHTSDECSSELCTYCGCCGHGYPRASGCPVAQAPAGMHCPNVECGCEGQA